jgi:hypothetical protein
MNGVLTIDCKLPRATHVATSGAADVVDSRYLFRKGPNGNYLFRLWAYPGKPLGHSVTMTGSKPIGANELPRSDRPWSSFPCCELQQTLLHHRHAPRRDKHSVPDSSCCDNQFTRPTYYHARYDGLERELAAVYDLELVDDSVIRNFIFNSPILPPGSWRDSSQHFSDDGLHPNSRGNQYFARIVSRHIENILGPDVRRPHTPD